MWSELTFSKEIKQIALLGTCTNRKPCESGLGRWSVKGIEADMKLRTACSEHDATLQASYTEKLTPVVHGSEPRSCIPFQVS